MALTMANRKKKKMILAASTTEAEEGWRAVGVPAWSRNGVGNGACQPPKKSTVIMAHIRTMLAYSARS